MTNERTPSDEAEIVDALLNDATYPGEIHGVQSRTQSYQGGSKEITVEIWEKPMNKSRLEVVSTEVTTEFDPETNLGQTVSTNGLENGGHVVIRNDNRLVKYDRDRNEYRRHNFETPDELAGSMIAPTLIGSSPRENFDITVRGSAEVAGREARVVEFEPLEDAEPFYRRYNFVRIWVDEEYWVPVKHEAEYELEDGTLVEADKFESVEFNRSIENSVFEFEPPEDAEEVSRTGSE